MMKFRNHILKASGNMINFAGKFSDDSTPDDWFFNPDRKKLSIADFVDPNTKEFAFRWDRKVTSTYDWFCDVRKLQRLDRLPDLSKATIARGMFARCYELEEINIPELNLINAGDLTQMFTDCKSLVHMGARIITTGDLTSLRGMFTGCLALEYVDLSGFDTSNVTDIYNMFCDCHNVTSLDLSAWEFNAGLSSSSGAFARCYNLKSIDMSGFTADTLSNANPSQLFIGSSEINHIRTTQGFKDFAIANQDLIKLPALMRDGGVGVWEIID